MSIIVKHKGNFNKTEKFLKKASKANFKKILEEYARIGRNALASATPIDTGTTASSWGYEIIVGDGSYTIAWTNSNNSKGIPIALLIQYGHATRNGGYVQGRDFINPALQPLFDKMAQDLWKEVSE